MNAFDPSDERSRILDTLESVMPKYSQSVPAIGPIVSSAHLAQGNSPAMSEVEYGLIIANNAFARWTVRCMAAAGFPGLSSLEVLILHSIRHRSRPKKIADLCLVLDIEDLHLVSYALKKLEKAGLLVTKRLGKEKIVEISDLGIQACDTYGQIRERLLIEATQNARPSEQNLSELAAMLRFLSGAFNQAARSAATL